ncbi:AI-2E family transporter [Flavihumibacter sp. R14]|nr:AI-2E family transporter [Flavihumibacter soli]
MENLQRSVYLLLFFFLAIGSLFYAREFLIPLALSAMLAMLFVRLSNYLEDKGLGRGWSALICVLLLVIFVAGAFTLLSYQISNLADNMGGIKKRLVDMLEHVKLWIYQTFGVSYQKQEQIFKEQSKANGGGSIGTFAGSFMGILVNSILVTVYIFLLLYSRDHIKQFILKLFPSDKRTKTEKVMGQSVQVAQKYLSGLSAMIVMLWIMYGIGFTIVGVEYAVFFAILCGLLEIVPFVGNITGTSVTILAVLVQGGDGGMILGVLITYMLVQFFQTYVLEPLVVGEQVSINPLFTIMVIVLGEMVWGVAGMILAIPLLGIVKIICDNVPALKPYGFLIGSEKKKGKPGVITRIRAIFKRT